MMAPRGGKRPGSGRPKGSRNKQRVLGRIVYVRLPVAVAAALEAEALREGASLSGLVRGGLRAGRPDLPWAKRAETT